MLSDWRLLVTAVVVLTAAVASAATVTAAPSRTTALGEGGDAANGQAKESQAGKDTTEHDKAKNEKSQAPQNGEHKEQTQGEKKQDSKTNAASSAKPNNSTSKASKTTKGFCNKTSDCASFNGSACVPDLSKGQKRCLCGNLTPPQKPETCLNIKRYVKFPCTEDSQCIANALCVLASTKNTDHAMDTPTASLCWCKEGFEATPDNSHCLDELGRLKMDLKKLEQGQVFVQERLRALESSGSDNVPSLTIAVVTAASLLVFHY